MSRLRRCAQSFASSFGLAALGAFLPLTLAVIGRALGDARPSHLRNDEWLTVRRLYRTGRVDPRQVEPAWHSWPRLPNGPVLRAGEAGPAVPVLRRRLAAEGILSSAAGSDTLDAALVGAVAAFPLRHGLTVGSLIGPRTRAALNVPASRRVRQIGANIERLRWLPPNPGTFATGRRCT